MFVISTGLVIGWTNLIGNVIGLLISSFAIFQVVTMTCEKLKMFKTQRFEGFSENDCEKFPVIKMYATIFLGLAAMLAVVMIVVSYKLIRGVRRVSNV